MTTNLTHLAVFLAGATIPPFLTGLYSVLTGAAPEVALACFVMAALAFRGGAGDLDLRGNFIKWIKWGMIFVGLNTVPLFLNAAGVSMCIPSGGTPPVYLTAMNGVVNLFVSTYLVTYVVPACAAAMVLKALLDSAEGKSPVPSIVSALLILSVSGLNSVAQSAMNTNNEFGIATGLLNLVTWAGTKVCPMIACLCVIGAIINYIRGKSWGQLVFTAIACLCFSGIWLLVQSWG